jgi:hypothetical protein
MKHLFDFLFLLSILFEYVGSALKCYSVNVN